MERTPGVHAVIGIGASAGGLEALTNLVAALPADLSAPVLVVLHVPATRQSTLPEILSRAGPLVATHAVDGEPLRPGHIFVAPPGLHLKVAGTKVSLDRGPRENSVRPAIDVLFRSMARSAGQRAIGVVLSGLLDDGTTGLAEIKRRGGLAMVQDPAGAAFPSMPATAAREAPADVVAEPVELARIMAETVRGLAEKGEAPSVTDEAEVPDEGRAAQASAEEQEGMLIPLTCPACGGSLWEDDPAGAPHFHCRVGHAYSAESLLAGQYEALEEALWGAVAALEEQSDFCRRMHDRFVAKGMDAVAGRYSERSDDAKKQADTLRSVVFSLIESEAENRD